MSGYTTTFASVVQRDLLLAFRHRGDALNPLVFFLIVITLFPLGLDPTSDVLATMAPAIVWVAALLANILALEHLFKQDFDDGVLEQFALSPCPLIILVLAKMLACWLVSGLPLLIAVPLAALMLGMPVDYITTLFLGLLLGTPTLTLIGAIGVALTVGLRQGGALLSLLVLPLYIPVLIFGANVISALAEGYGTSGPLLMLAAMQVLAITLAPLAVTAALRVSLN